MINHLRQMRWVAFALLGAIYTGCKKEEARIANSKQTSNEVKELLQFVSNITKIPQDKLRFDQEKEVFYLPNTSFNLKYDEALKI